MDFVKDTVDSKLNKDAQPGNNIERTADNSVNQGTKLLLIRAFPCLSRYVESRR